MKPPRPRQDQDGNDATRRPHPCAPCPLTGRLEKAKVHYRQQREELATLKATNARLQPSGTGQLALFDAGLHAENAELTASCEWLTQRLARVEERCAELERTAAQRDVYVQTMESEVRLLRSLRNLHQTIRDTFDASRAPGPPDARLLTALTKIAHPDRWSQNQKAEELAHELMVVINNAREGADGH